ncbi:MAG: hypothetical protein IZT56_12555 [Bacteroidetes bacterium]|nr:hypothetical protein [Bacteroidota bacterium]
MKLITPQRAKDLNKHFVDTRSTALDEIVEKESGKPNEKDAISSWFSLDELKEYIAFVEAEGKLKNITINGLRVYFGAYSKNENKPEKKNLSTVFFVPTQSKKGSMQKDSLGGGDGGSDIEDIDGLNTGGLGFPPSAEYPQ